MELSERDKVRVDNYLGDMRDNKRTTVEYKDARMRLGKLLHELPHGGVTSASRYSGVSGGSLDGHKRYYLTMRRSGYGRHI